MLDHLVYATPSLPPTIAVLARLLGVQPTAGGRHTGLGTRNVLLDLGESTYLEIIGVDPEGPEPEGPRPFGLDHLAAPRLVTWAARVKGIDAAVERARAAGHDPGPVQSMERRLPDGTLLAWRLTLPGPAPVEVVPFLIDWGDAVHPSKTSAQGCRLVRFEAQHPDPDTVAPLIEALGSYLNVREEPKPGLSAVIEGPAGSVVLR